MNPRAGAGLPLMTQINAQIVPNLWFDRQAEEAAAHYIAAFGGNGRIVTTIASHPDSPSPQDVPVVVEFELAGQRFVGINGGPQFTFSEAVSLEVRVTGPKTDLHSGIYGGVVMNPATALARLLATLHDADSHVAVPGFYDNVQPLAGWEREAWAMLPFGDAQILEVTGAP